MTSEMENLPCAWMGSLLAFLATPEEVILRELSHAGRETGMPQLFAWDRSLVNLREELQVCLPEAADFSLILEFELPRSGGRRPDLIVLENGTVLVIEFKNRVEAEHSDIDQVLGYVRDLRHYHAESRERELIPILIPIGWNREEEIREGVRIVSPKGLAKIIRTFAVKSRRKPSDPSKWIQASYEPLPALIEAPGSSSSGSLYPGSVKLSRRVSLRRLSWWRTAFDKP